MAVEVYPGNTGDPTTVADQVEKLRERFGLVPGGAGGRSRDADPAADRQAQAHPRMGWITALTSVAIRGLLAEGALQLSLLDQKNLAEITRRTIPASG